MGLKKTQAREFAKILYTQHGLNLTQIADKTSVTTKTIGKWRDEENWDSLRSALTTTRSSIINNLQRQMELWQLEIGDNLASSKETDILIKLANSIKALEVETGVGEVIDTQIKFIEFLQLHQPELAQQITHWSDLFIQTRM
ncbi:hypothetical protein QP519_11390 [Weeksella virosa]|uniref:hypothetical protein n=2 Tax=Weeksella virosa TaxID=1014 RepID=UPI002555886F|nr:hypothetical protein [Weeksella virosa]MDK7376136.1 hypothetical protein [Weeksella virosa]MDK7674383.1 hypothetical protein [Weeksella virosa]